MRATAATAASRYCVSGGAGAARTDSVESTDRRTATHRTADRERRSRTRARAETRFRRQRLVVPSAGVTDEI